MRPRSSSTSSSSGLRVRGRVRKVLATLGWTLACLAAIDVAAGVAFRYPTSNAVRPNAMQQYFEYGRSLRGKLQRMVTEDERTSDPMVSVGWIDQQCTPKPPFRAGRLGVAFYGMSFTNRIADAIEAFDPDVRARRYAGPAAPPNHSYACFLRQRDGREPARVQVLGILASSVKGLLTLSGMTTTFEKPTPFTFPRFVLDAAGGLRRIDPLIADEAALREAVLHDPAKWDAFVAQLERDDRFYSRTYMGGPTFADGSTLVRLARRALSQHAGRARAEAVLSSRAGFADDAEVGPVLRAIVVDFAARCRADGQVPLIVLIQDQRPGDALTTLLGPTLDAANVAYVATNDVAPPENVANLASDGHFSAAANERVARVVDEKIHAIAAARP